MWKNKIIKDLEKEIEECRNENLKLFEEKLALERKLFNLYMGELTEKLESELELSPRQKVKLELLCSVECARLLGVSEDKILHNIDEINEFFSQREP